MDTAYGKLKEVKERHILHYCNKKKKQCNELKKFLKEITCMILGAIQNIPKWIWEEVKCCVEKMSQIFEGLTGKKLKLVF